MSTALRGATQLPDGTLVRGRALRDRIPKDPLPDYGLYLVSRPGQQPGTTSPRHPRWSRLRRRRRFEPSWEADWILWPDFRTPADPQQAAQAILKAFRRAQAGRRVEVACGGGNGRTGTVLACMAVLAGLPATQAVGWVRASYRTRAVETRRQRAWIEWFARQDPRPSAFPNARDPVVVSGQGGTIPPAPPAATKESPMTEHPYDIEITRVVDAPPERVYRAFTDPDQFARWYGPVGFPVHPGTVEVDARVGGRQRFEMVGEADPSVRTGFDGRFVEVVQDELLSSSGAWDGIPGQAGAWPSNLRVEFHDDEGRTRLVVREGPHPPGTADLGRQAWEMMLSKLEALLSGWAP